LRALLPFYNQNEVVKIWENIFSSIMGKKHKEKTLEYHINKEKWEGVLKDDE